MTVYVTIVLKIAFLVYESDSFTAMRVHSGLFLGLNIAFFVNSQFLENWYVFGIRSFVETCR
jgi:hypothetical protein